MPATSDTRLPRPADAKVEKPSFTPSVASISSPATSCSQKRQLHKSAIAICYVPSTQIHSFTCNSSIPTQIIAVGHSDGLQRLGLTMIKLSRKPKPTNGRAAARATEAHMPNVGGSVLPAFAAAVSCRSSFSALINSSLNARKSVPDEPMLTAQYPAEVCRSGGSLV